MKTRKPLKSKTPLKSTKPTERTKIKGVSKKTRKRTRDYRRAVPLKGVLCHWCGCKPAKERHHVYQKSEAAYLYTEVLNILPLCRECHAAVTGREKAYREEFRGRWPERMKELDWMYENLGKDNALKRIAETVENRPHNVDSGSSNLVESRGTERTRIGLRAAPDQKERGAFNHG